MNPQMSQQTKQEVLAQWRARYARAGRQYKTKILDEVVALFDCHRKSAVRMLRARPASPPAAPYARGRPRTYDPERLLPPLRAIWAAALYPCGARLQAALPVWLPAYEEAHGSLETDVRQALLSASRATLDRLLAPLRAQAPSRRRRGTTNVLRAEIPIHTEWTETEPGYLELDTVALCGGRLDDRHGWMLDAVDIHTTWSVLRGLPNRSEASVSGHLEDLAASLPFPLRGLDSDNGGEFINHQLLRWCRERTPPVALTRSRHYRKNDQAHIEQKNYTNVRVWFGYERYAQPELWPLVNALCRGPLHQLLNYFLPTLKLREKVRVGSRTVRRYGPARTPLDRVLACPEVPPSVKQRLRAERAGLNPFAVRAEVDRQRRRIEAVRRATEA